MQRDGKRDREMKSLEGVCSSDGIVEVSTSEIVIGLCLAVITWDILMETINGRKHESSEREGGKKRREGDCEEVRRRNQWIG